MPRTPLTDKTILVTGAAGFIGANLALRLLKEVPQVNLIGLDSVNDYYDVSIKEYRLGQIEALAKEKPGSRWTFIKGNLADKDLISRICWLAMAMYGLGRMRPSPSL